jgi:hypothetical protein
MPNRRLLSLGSDTLSEGDIYIIYMLSTYREHLKAFRTFEIEFWATTASVIENIPRINLSHLCPEPWNPGRELRCILMQRVGGCVGSISIENIEILVVIQDGYNSGSKGVVY